LPGDILRDLNRVFRLRFAQQDPHLANKWRWAWSRTTAWRHVKAVMATARVAGTPAAPKGLHHGFGVKAFRWGVRDLAARRRSESTPSESRPRHLALHQQQKHYTILI
jgi:hypothetical protein